MHLNRPINGRLPIHSVDRELEGKWDKNSTLDTQDEPLGTNASRICMVIIVGFSVKTRVDEAGECSGRSSR